MTNADKATAAREAYWRWYDQDYLGSFRGKAGASEEVRVAAEKAVRRALPILTKQARDCSWEHRLDAIVHAGKRR